MCRAVGPQDQDRKPLLNRLIISTSFPVRALVEMLRHQSSPVQEGERNNSVALGTGGGEGTLGRPPKNLYPTLQSKDNRREWKTP